MNNTCCFTFNIRQFTCQNGITRNFDNIHTNILPGTDIQLNFGYIFSFLSGTANTASIAISNNLTLPSVVFNIPSGSFRVFDLPCECGTYRVFVGAVPAPCGVTSLNCAE